MTTAPLTVAFDAAGADDHAARYAAQRAALASLPGSFRMVPGPSADILVTIAGGTGWLDRIGRPPGAPVKAVLIAGVMPAAIDELRGLAALAAHRRLTVAIASGPADDAAWQAALPDARRDLAGLTFIDSVAAAPAGGCLFDALLDQLALAESLTGTLERAAILAVTASHYVLSADAGAVAVSLSGSACTAAPGSVELDLVGPGVRWRAEFSAASPARPAQITRHDATGAHARRPLFQGPQRARWLRMRDDLAVAGDGDGGAGETAPLASLIARAELAARVAGVS